MDNQYYVDIIASSLERTIRRLWIVIILLIVILVGTNIGWLVYESQFETVTTEQTVWQDASNGTNRFIGGDYYGTADSQDGN